VVVFLLIKKHVVIRGACSSAALRSVCRSEQDRKHQRYPRSITSYTTRCIGTLMTLISER
jgi:hypothetical protein